VPDGVACFPGRERYIAPHRCLTLPDRQLSGRG
jgi:hypothetical protein